MKTYGSINEGDTSKDTAGKLTSLKATQEGHTKAFESTKGQVWVDRQGISRNGAFLGAVDQNYQIG